MACGIYVAIDTPAPERAAALCAQLAGVVAGVKLGLEFFTAHGPDGIRRLALGAPLFLDLKLHDIPNTVAGAVRSAAALQPSLLTVHAAGGEAMLRAAASAAAEAGPGRPRLLAITVLTSLGAEDLAAVGQQGPVLDQARRLAALAQRCAIDGVVCSPHEIAALRAECGPDFLLVVPGIRPAGSDAADQVRVMTPPQAARQGADYLVIGRPITGAPQPAEAARRFAQEIAAAELA